MTYVLTLPEAKKPTSPKDRLKHSYKRSYKLTAARKQNLTYYRQVNNYILERKNEVSDLLVQYRKNLICCGSNNLYRGVEGGQECTLIASHTCSHRLCSICNMLRARKMRRKWRHFLTDTSQDVPIKKNQAHFFGIAPESYGKYQHITRSGKTISKAEKDIYFTSGAELLQHFDLMHMTLTVPHANGRWNGREYYAQELIERFNTMRKASWWTETIFGGEYTIETTKNENGLHIHIHALLFVDKEFFGSRNFLTENILRRWNYLTVEGGQRFDGKKVIRELFRPDEDKERIEGLKKSLSFLSENDFNDLLLDLDRRGSTMVGIKTLYYEIPAEEYAQRSTGIFEQNGKYYAYCRPGRKNGTSQKSIDSMVKGVVECLKYHFEPCSLEDDDGSLDIDMIVQILPNIYGKRLYGKFGGFYGVKALNVVEDPLSEADMLEDAAENAGVVYDPVTGEEIEDQQCYYAIADSSGITFDEGGEKYMLSQSAIKKKFVGGSLSFAIKILFNYSTAADRQKNVFRIET